MTLTATQTTNNLQNGHHGIKPTRPSAGTEGGFRKQDELQKKVDDALANLQSALSNGDSDTLKAYLAFLGRFHNYSFGNQILIYLQNPDATHVAGFQRWKALGRYVKKGETGIRILAPMVRGRNAEAEISETASDSENSH